MDTSRSYSYPVSYLREAMDALQNGRVNVKYNSDKRDRIHAHLSDLCRGQQDNYTIDLTRSPDIVLAFIIVYEPARVKVCIKRERCGQCNHKTCRCGQGHGGGHGYGHGNCGSCHKKRSECGCQKKRKCNSCHHKKCRCDSSSSSSSSSSLSSSSSSSSSSSGDYCGCQGGNNYSQRWSEAPPRNNCRKCRHDHDSSSSRW